MEVEISNRTLVTSGSLGAMSFGFAEGSEAHMFHILRNSVYSNKELAVLREYASNAWDAHRDAGKGDVPIKVRLPTSLEPTLVIRDYGKGLSPQEVRSIYTQYGASTKRQSNDAVGFMGIGSKSAFCYTDTFTITSYHGGMKRVYVATLDETECGDAHLMYEEPCGDETGIEIKIAVSVKDVKRFHIEAEYLFPFFQPQPDINIAIPKPDPFGSWLCVMGCIPYRLSITNLDIAPEEYYLLDMSAGNDRVLYVDIGEISVSASREEVAYNDRTKAALIARLKDMYVTRTRDLQAIWADTSLPPFQRRLALVRTNQQWKVVPKELGRYVQETVQLFSGKRVCDGQGGPVVDAQGNYVYDLPHSFQFEQCQTRTESGLVRTQRVTYINVREDTRIVVLDTRKSLSGYDFKSEDDYLVRIKPKFNVADVLQELNAKLDAQELTGVPVVLASSLPHASDAKKRAQDKTLAKQRHFVLDLHKGTIQRMSQHWKPVPHDLTDNDVYVVLEHYRVAGFAEFYVEYARDCAALALMGGTMPPVYGVKRLHVKEGMKGQPYRTWRLGVLKALIEQNTEIQAKLDSQATSEFLGDNVGIPRGVHNWEFSRFCTANTYLKEVLPENHPYLRCRLTMAEARQQQVLLSDTDQNIYTHLLHLFPQYRQNDITNLWIRLQDRYPLFKINRYAHDDFSNSGKRGVWLEYINLKDKDQPWDTNSSTTPTASP